MAYAGRNSAQGTAHGYTLMLGWEAVLMRTCPASVPVIAEFCPHASRATPNRMRAASLPSAGASSWYASAMPPTSGCGLAP